MKRTKILTALLLSLTMILSLFAGLAVTETAQAAGTYTLKIWAQGEGTWTVNGKTSAEQSIKAGQKVTVVAKASNAGEVAMPTTAGTIQTLGMTYDEDGTAQFSFLMPERDLTLYLDFEEAYKITLDLNGGTWAEGMAFSETMYMPKQEGLRISLKLGGYVIPPAGQKLNGALVNGKPTPVLSSGIEITGDTEIKLLWTKDLYNVYNATVSGLAGQTYTGKALTPTPAVTLPGKTLKADRDFTATYKNNTKVGTATVTITGKGNFTGTKTVTFKIAPAEIGKATVTGLSAKTWTGSAIKPVPVVQFGGKTLKAGTDYTVAYKNNTNVGTAAVTLTGKGNFTGAANRTFAIQPVSLAKAAISGLKDMLYTGKAITQTPVVKLGTKTLKAGTDYTVKYAQNVSVGTATVTFTGKGNYAGSVKASFKIQDPVEEFVARLYRVCLDREPEAQGHAWWVARLRAKQETGGSCAWGFFDSTEFKNHKYSNSAFLDHAYAAFFDRKPDAAGKAYWLGEMKKGMTREQVIRSGFAVSNEWKALCRTYQIKP